MTIRVHTLSAEKHAELTRMARSHTLCAGRVKRAQLVLLAVDGRKAGDRRSLRLNAPTASPGLRKATGRVDRRSTRRSRSGR